MDSLRQQTEGKELLPVPSAREPTNKNAHPKFCVPMLLLLSWTYSCGAIADEALPRVLILGDAIYTQPANTITKMLGGKAEVVYRTTPVGIAHNSTSVLEHLDTLLGEDDWDLIHVNVGMGDLVYRVPNMMSFRVMSKAAGGIRATSPQQYERNLHELIKQLKSTTAKLIWANTTPIQKTSKGIFDVGSEVEYNKIATKVMTEHNVPINDVHSYALEHLDDKAPRDPFDIHRAVPLHPPMVKIITRELKLPPLP